MTFQPKKMFMIDLHVHLTLKLHLLSNIFQISNFTFSLEQVARGEAQHSTKWKEKPVLRQTTTLEVMSIRHRNDIAKSTRRIHRYFIDFKSLIDVELSMSNRCHFCHVDLPFIIDKISTNFQRGILMSNRWRIY